MVCSRWQEILFKGHMGQTATMQKISSLLRTQVWVQWAGSSTSQVPGVCIVSAFCMYFWRSELYLPSWLRWEDNFGKSLAKFLENSRHTVNGSSWLFLALFMLCISVPCVLGHSTGSDGLVHCTLKMSFLLGCNSYVLKSCVSCEFLITWILFPIHWPDYWSQWKSSLKNRCGLYEQSCCNQFPLALHPGRWASGDGAYSIISDRDGELDCPIHTRWENRGNEQVEWNSEICEKVTTNTQGVV